MSLYSRGTFGKDSSQWTKCVVKYLHDVYATASLSMVTFLVEVMLHYLNSLLNVILTFYNCVVKLSRLVWKLPLALQMDKADLKIRVHG